LAVLLKPEFNFGLQEVFLFIPALILAWALRFFWGYWLALLAFWTTRADALLILQDTLIFLLAGQVAPVTLLPSLMQTLAAALPFRYMVSFPVEILCGQLTTKDLAHGFLMQTIWLGLALFLTAVMWKKGTRRYGAIGG
jgi:ABC-2 type transport system permease protein